MFSFFDKNVIKETNPITIQVEKEPLNNFLNMVFKNQPLIFRIKEKAVIITARKIPSIINLDEVPPITGVVRGPDGQLARGG